jgi:hypothetical protein
LRWRASSVAMTVLLVAVARLAAAADATLIPVRHPNHYILVVDASYSTVRTPLRAKSYRQLLEVRLPEILTSRSFGNIPPAVPGRDYFTVVTFGIVTSRYDHRVAYKHLHEFSFRRDFIHPVVVRRRLSREELAGVLWPREFYRMTVLQWAKPATLASLPPALQTDVANRTFRIVVSDGEPNDGIVQAEKDVATSQGNEQDIAASQQWMQDAAAEVHVTDGAGREGEAVQQRVPVAIQGRTETFFLDAQELIPRSRAALEQRAAAVVPLERIGYEYLETGGGSTALRINAEPTRAFRGWLSAHGGSVGTAAWRQRGRDTPQPAMREPLRLALPPSHNPCVEFDVAVEVVGQVQHRDARYGLSVLEYRFAQNALAPPAPTCVAARLRRTLTRAAVVLFLVLLIAYFLFQRLAGSRPSIEIPGIVARFPLRHGTATARPFHPPRKGAQAFIVHLPPPWKQRLFCRGMRISVDGDCAPAVQWLPSGGELRLPFEGGDIVTASWTETPAQQCTLRITSNGVAASAAVTVDYPTPVRPR